MRIGIDARVLQEERRGQGQYLYYLVKSLLEIDKDNEYVLFYNGLKGGKFAFDLTIPNLQQIWCHVPGRILKKLWSYLSWPYVELLSGPIDIFHHTMNCNMTHYTPIPTHKKMVATFHGIASPELLSTSYTYKDFKDWAKSIASSASIIIAVSRAAKENFLEYASFPEDRMRVIYLAADPIFQPIEDKEFLQVGLSRYGLSDKKYILYVGGGEKNKNLKRLLQAFSTIKANDELYLVLAGGISAASLQDELKAVGERVIFSNHIPHADLVFLYNGATAFVLPSLYESFPLPIIEAMSCGTPVVGSKNMGSWEVVGEAALTFDPENVEEMADCMIKILMSERLRVSLVEKGNKKLGLLSWEKTAKDTISVYEELK